MADKMTCVGILSAQGSDGSVLTDYPVAESGRMKIFVPSSRLNGAPFGMRVVCQVDQMADNDWQGSILEVIGDPARPDVAIEGILRHYGLHQDFPDKVKEAAERYGTDPVPEGVEDMIANGRRDLRGLPTLTIDGADAKDLDDAISIRREPDGGYRLWVHIADVAQYVTEDSPLDREARRRGTSVYLVDRVVPMLPPRLSNGICSLNPRKDRLALTAEMEIDAQGRTTGGDLYESVIQSDARTTYTEIKEFLTENAHRDRYGFLEQEILTMNELAEILQANMRERGMLGFEFPETVVKLDSDGTPVDIYAYPISFTNGIIEAFMIACNEFVAYRFNKMKAPFVYRVHELPDVEKLKRFTSLASNMGIRFHHRGNMKPKELAVALEKIKELQNGEALSHLLLRSLAKARYAPDNLGHYGLASKYYCHFTSPIRRYPDLFIHRVIKGWISGHMNTGKWRSDASSVSDTSSLTERAADQAERDTNKQKACEYMSARLGEEFEGTISGIIPGGFFVQLDNTVEGMVPFRLLEDYFEYDENTLTAKGVRSGKIFHIGNAVKVRVARVDTILRRIDFEMLEIEGEPAATIGKAARSGGKQKKPARHDDRRIHLPKKGVRRTKNKGRSGRKRK